MKRSMRILTAAVFFTVVISLNSFASSLLCSAGPTSKFYNTGNWIVIYSCTVPANTVALNKALKITLDLQQQALNTSDFEVYFNGFTLEGGAPTATNQFAELTVMNTGTTTGEKLWLETNSSGVVQAGVSPVTGLSWASQQTVQVQVYPLYTTDWVDGAIFTVEVLD